MLYAESCTYVLTIEPYTYHVLLLYTLYTIPHKHIISLYSLLPFIQPHPSLLLLLLLIQLGLYTCLGQV